MAIFNTVYGGDGQRHPSDNTIAYYPLTANANDYSGNNRNGNASNVSFTTLNGVECAYFSNSSNSKITGSFGLGASDITISLWFNTSSCTQVFSMLGMCGGNPSLQVWLRNGKTAQGDIWDGSSDVNISDGNCRDGNWHNAIATYDRQNLKFYVDGAFIGQSAATVGIPLTNMGIGGHYDSSGNPFWYLGYISNVIYEKKAWTSDEVIKYYNSTKSNYGL